MKKFLLLVVLAVLPAVAQAAPNHGPAHRGGPKVAHHGKAAPRHGHHHAHPHHKGHHGSHHVHHRKHRHGHFHVVPRPCPPPPPCHHHRHHGNFSFSICL